ncbi:MAG: hypothetical protein ETSY2_10385 [Candidatus Entotheonella gemina]|uniref:Uncharacterized protein n=1 Tax=Candidatus Entotheonella gemina TaxID=1429439 RepID=W4MBK8_9BACT|nr:MAG: hypothetical protein ETSY2_10385 [Candidatus Entotheonella gemina]
MLGGTHKIEFVIDQGQADFDKLVFDKLAESSSEPVTTVERLAA